MNDHRLDERLTRHLTNTAEHTLLRPSTPEQAMHVAERRSTHRRHVTAIGTVAAVTIVTVVGVRALTRPADAVEMLPTAGVGTTAPAGTGTGGSSTFPPATLVDPQMVWNPVEPDSTAAVATVFSAQAGSVFPGLAVSTSPASSITPTFQYWHSDDGVTFTEVPSRPPGGPLLESIAIGDHAYAFGTAPGVAATEPNPLLGSITNDAGTTWDQVTIPFDTNELRRNPQVASAHNYVSGLVDTGGPVMMSVGTGINLDFEALGIPDTSVVEVTADGIGFSAKGCTPSPTPVTTIVFTADEATASETDAATPASTTPTEDVGDSEGSCPIEHKTWAQLGVPPDLAEMATDNPRSQLFYAADARTFTELQPPVDDYQQITLPSPTLPIVSVRRTDGTSRLFRTDDGANWTELPTPPINVERLTELNGRLVAVGDTGSSMRVATLDGDVWTTAQVDLLASSYMSMYVGPAGIAIVGADPNTDTANGSPVPSTIESPTDTSPTGTQVPDTGSADGAPRMSIAYSLDGISWSIESIDELLGDKATDDERPAVLRVSSTGNQLVVAVTLDATSDHEPGGRQIALIGTPTG